MGHMLGLAILQKFQRPNFGASDRRILVVFGPILKIPKPRKGSNGQLEHLGLLNIS